MVTGANAPVITNGRTIMDCFKISCDQRKSQHDVGFSKPDYYPGTS